MAVEASLTESKPVAVIGAGSWGTALAMVAARNRHDVTLWAREREVVNSIATDRRNPFYLSDFELPENIRATTSLEDSLRDASLVLVVVPSHAFREMIGSMLPFINDEMVIVSATKGVENRTLMRMDEVIADVCGDKFEDRFVALSGPSFAREVAKGDPTAIVAASRDCALSAAAQKQLSSSVFRVYTNDDVIG